VGQIRKSPIRAADPVAHAEHELRGLVRDLPAAAVADGEVRTDLTPAELAGFCLHALAAANGPPSKAAVRRLVDCHHVWHQNALMPGTRAANLGVGATC
jgi:hypothetical protein